MSKRSFFALSIIFSKVHLNRLLFSLIIPPHYASFKQSCRIILLHFFHFQKILSKKSKEQEMPHQLPRTLQHRMLASNQYRLSQFQSTRVEHKWICPLLELRWAAPTNDRIAPFFRMLVSSFKICKMPHVICHIGVKFGIFTSENYYLLYSREHQQQQREAANGSKLTHGC